MDADLFTALLDKGIPFAMMAVAVLYFRDLNNKKDTIILNKDAQIAKLNEDMRDILIQTVNSSANAITNNAAVLSSLKEVFLNHVK